MLSSVASMIGQFNMPNIKIMLDMGYEVHVACNFKEGNTCGAQQIRELQKTLRNLHVMQHQWDCPRSIRPVHKCITAYKQLQGLLGRHRFAWLHCHSPIGSALARLAAYRRGVRVIYTAHGFHFYKGAPVRNWLAYYPAEKLLSHWTDVLVTVNQEDYRFAGRHLKPGKVCHIPGIGIDVEKYASTDAAKALAKGEEKKEFSRKYRIPENTCVLLSVGELNEGKNHRMAIHALAQLKRKDVYYLICGQGCLKEELQQYADSLGVGERIRMPGFQENMPFIYRNADIFVFPSRREGLPAALMEAMSAGLPCVVSDIRGNRELVGEAMRFSLDDPRQLVHALKALLEDAKLRRECGLACQDKVKGYRMGIVEGRMREIYQYMGRISEISTADNR